MSNKYATPNNAAPALEFDEGLRAFFMKTYNLMMLGILTSGVIAFVVANTGLLSLMVSPEGGIGMTFWLVVAFEFAMILWFIPSALSSGKTATASMWFFAFAAANGLTLAPIASIYTDASMAKTFFLTASVFGVASLYGYSTKRDLLRYRDFFLVGLIALLIAMIVNIFLASPVMDFALSGIGVILFTALTAYDTQKLKVLYDENPGQRESIAIMGALELYLDFVNLFLFLLRLIGIKTSD